MRQRLAGVAAALACGTLLAAAGCASSGPGDADKPSGAASHDLRLVVIGDSIPFNASFDCPGCTGFVDRYAEALQEATGSEVTTANLSQHNSLTLPMLMDELQTFEEQLSGADAIIVGIAHNSFGLNSDKPCGTTFDEAASTLEDWSKVTRQCAEAGAAEYRPTYDELFQTIASWREGRPTVLLTINKYNDWNGWEAAHLTPGQVRRTVFMHDAWNRMVCESAESHDFRCADIYHAINGEDGRTPSGDLLAADYTHPSDKGNELIAHVLVDQGFAPLA